MEETLKEKVTYPRLCKESSWLGIKSLPLGSCVLTSGIFPWTDWCSLLKHCWCSSFRCFCSVICKNSKLHSFNKYCIKQQIIQEKIAPSCSPNVVFLEFFVCLFSFQITDLYSIYIHMLMGFSYSLTAATWQHNDCEKACRFSYQSAANHLIDWKKWLTFHFLM